MKIPYWPLLLGPGLLFGLGFLSNAIVMAVNHGQMPVLWPGGCTPETMEGDLIHSCMTHATHLKFLADWVVIRGFGIASPGDFCEWAYEYIAMPAHLIWALLMIEKTGPKISPPASS